MTPDELSKLVNHHYEASYNDSGKPRCVSILRVEARHILVYGERLLIQAKKAGLEFDVLEIQGQLETFRYIVHERLTKYVTLDQLDVDCHNILYLEELLAEGKAS